VALSADGSRLVSAGVDHEVKVWDPVAGKELFRFTKHAREVTSVAVSPDGSRVVSCSEPLGATANAGYVGSEVYLWEARPDGKVASIAGPNGWVAGAAFSPDGRSLAVAYWTWDGKQKTLADGEVGVFNAGDGQKTASFKIPENWDQAHTTTDKGDSKVSVRWTSALAFSPDGKLLVVPTQTGVIVLDLDAGRQDAAAYEDFGAHVFTAFSPDGRRLATAAADGAVKVWSTDTRRRICTFNQGKEVRGMAIGVDGRRVTTWGEDQGLNVWDGTTGHFILKMPLPSPSVSGAAWSPDGRRLAVASAYRAGNNRRAADLYVFDPGVDPEPTYYAWHTETITSAAVDPTGRRVAAGGRDHVVKVWDARTGRLLYDLAGHAQPISCVAFSPDGKRLATGDRDGVVKVWDALTGTEVANFTTLGRWPVFYLAFRLDDQQVAVGHADGLSLYDIQAGASVPDPAPSNHGRRIEFNGGSIQALAFSPDGQRAVGVTGEGSLFSREGDAGWNYIGIWNAKTGQLLYALGREGFSKGVPEGAFLLTIGEATVGKAGTVRSVSFSPDGKWAVAGTGDRVLVWEAETGKKRRVFKGHTVGVDCVAFSPDGKRLATCAHGVDPDRQQGTIAELKVWDFEKGQELYKYDRRASFEVGALAFSPDGKRVIFGNDRLVRVWKLPEDDAAPPKDK
jgi:WD40 repeat protein